MPTVAEIQAELRALGLPTQGRKAALIERLDRAKHRDYVKVGGQRIIGGALESGTCPNSADPIDLEDFEPGDTVQQLRNSNFTMGSCYHDRTLKGFMETTARDLGPLAEDMGSRPGPPPDAP